MVQETTMQEGIISNDTVKCGCCKIPARLGTLVNGSFQTVASLAGLLYIVLQQKTRIFKTKFEEQSPTDVYIDQIFGTLIAICICQALLGILLVIATIGRKGVLKILSYPWIPITAILLLTYYILKCLAWSDKIQFWNDYYGNCVKMKCVSSCQKFIATFIIDMIGSAIWFSTSVVFVWTFIKTDYKNTADPNQS